MKTLVFGQSGQVARELQAQGQVIALSRSDADLSDPASCAAAILHHDPQVVINAAAYTAVDKAEAERDLAQLVNADAPAAMARACASTGARFLHISTDYVFDGSGQRPWTPQDETDPLGVYGQTKLDGETAVAGAGARHAILRTSWVFSAHGNNFVKTMLRLGADRDELTIVADQIGGPTPAADIAAALLAMAAQPDGPDGIYHFGGAPWVSWADFAREIFAQSQVNCRVTDIPTSQFPTPARRPANSRLDGQALARDYGISPPDWREGLTKVLDELTRT